MPYANTFVKYNLLRPTEIDYIICKISQVDIPSQSFGGHQSRIGPRWKYVSNRRYYFTYRPNFQRLKNGQLSTGANWNFNNDWTIPGSTNANPPPDNTYGPLMDTGQALGNDSPFAGPGASSSTGVTLPTDRQVRLLKVLI